MAKRTVYYESLSDDFSGTHIKTQRVRKDFPFAKRGFIWRICSFLLYYFIAFPVVFVFCTLFLGLRIHNLKAVRGLRKRGFFLYGNHTQYLDPFIPPLIAFPHRAYTVAHADAISIFGLRHIVMMLGGIPVPKDIPALKNFKEALCGRYSRHSCIAIYPEAKIWPYYTGVRPFPDASFKYPADMNAPVVAMFTSYRKRWGIFGSLLPPAWGVYLSDPIYPDSALPPKQARRRLRDEVYGFMKYRSSLGGYEHVCYRPAYEESDSEQTADPVKQTAPL